MQISWYNEPRGEECREAGRWSRRQREAWKSDRQRDLVNNDEMEVLAVAVTGWIMEYEVSSRLRGMG